MNSILLIGRMTKDSELRYTQSGKAVCKFDIAVDRRFKTDNGTKADFFSCQIWGKPAEAVAQYTAKGSKVAVRGEAQNNNYEKDGVKHYGMIVNAEQVDFLDSKPKEQIEGLRDNFEDEGFQSIEDDFSDDIPF